MRLALDNHYSPMLAARLREADHDVVAARDAGWDRLDDDALLAACDAQDRALLTNNVRDFVVIAEQWQALRRRHAAIVFTSDRSLPRHLDGIGRYVEVLTALLDAHPEPRALEDRVHWL